MKYTLAYGDRAANTREDGKIFVKKDHSIPPRIPVNTCVPGIPMWAGWRPRQTKALREPTFVERGGISSMPGYTGFRPGIHA